MKAIVMAGGEGKRLRPVTSGRPKPMTELFGRPVLEHTVELLKRNGITDICFTLRYLPGVIEEWFGDGQSMGVRIETRTENEPLGTAGGVRACADFIGDEDVLVISGDAVCDFDLKKCIAFHKKRRADATLVLYEHPEPLEYGLVVTDGSGRIRRFIEKPGWDMVVTDAVNTGIYVLSPQTVASVPDGEYDFGKDLFPRMLREGRALYGVCAEGYWCDIGSPEAYRECCTDILAGKTEIRFSAPEKRPGIFSHSDISGGAELVPPVWIGNNCVLGKSARIGPNTVLGDGSTVSAGAAVTGSVINGASVGAGAVVSDAVVGRGSVIGENSQIEENAVIGDGVRIGAGALVTCGVKVWPEAEIPGGVRVSEDVREHGGKKKITFGGDAAVTGEYPHGISAEVASSMGSAAASFERVGTAHCGGETARVLASAFSCGVCGAGGETVETDASFPSEAAFAFELYGLGAGVFIRQDGTRVTMTFFGKNGRMLDSTGQRKLEDGASRRGESAGAGGLIRTAGISQAYIAAAVREAGIVSPGYTVCVSGHGAENRALRDALTLMGCRVLTEKRIGTADFNVCGGGFLLEATDEDNLSLTAQRMQTIAALCAMESGIGAVSVPFDAPGVLETVAEAHDCVIVRDTHDADSVKELRTRQRFMRDGVFAACRIVSHMTERGISLSALNAAIPGFATAQRSVRTLSGAARAMRSLSEAYAEFSDDLVGLSADTGNGRVRVSPCDNGRAVSIKAEGSTEEIAEELCAELEKKLSDTRENGG